MIKIIKGLLTNKKGDIGIFVFIMIFIVMSLSVVIIEYMRVYSLRDTLEYELQRGINVALEDAIIDSWRSDALKGISVNTLNCFEDYLINDMDLSYNDGWYRLGLGKSTKYELKIDQLRYWGETDNYELNLQATINIKTIFKNILGSDILIPINVKSRNNIIKNMPVPDFAAG